jgi:hypothetical protein
LCFHEFASNLPPLIRIGQDVMKGMFALLVASLALVVGSAQASATGDQEEQRFAGWIHRGLLDPDAPIEKRREIAAEIEALTTDDAEPLLLYLMGSLYHQDPDHSGSPLPQNLDRARELLSRAALHGRLPAMAKLSTIELQAGNRFEANVWAQLYYHYAKDQAKADPRWSEGFAASILRNALDGFPKSDMDSLSASVGAMITQYDEQIRQGLSKAAEEMSRNRLRDARPGKRVLLNSRDTTGRTYDSGIAEYVIEFAGDGTIKQLWTLDAWPNPKLGKVLRNVALGYRVDSKLASEAAGAVSILPLEFADGRYTIRDEPASH